MGKTNKGEVDFEEGAEGDVIDFSQTKDDAGFELIPKSVQPCIIEDIEFDISEAGNKMWRVTLKIREGDFEGRKLFTFVVFSQKAMSLAKKAIRAFAPELLDKPFNPESILNEIDLIGRTVAARVAFDRYEGRRTNKVKELLEDKGGDSFL